MELYCSGGGYDNNNNGDGSRREEDSTTTTSLLKGYQQGRTAIKKTNTPWTTTTTYFIKLSTFFIKKNTHTLDTVCSCTSTASGDDTNNNGSTGLVNLTESKPGPNIPIYYLFVVRHVCMVDFHRGRRERVRSQKKTGDSRRVGGEEC